MSLPGQIDASIVTLSYRGDFDYCRLLCQSLDAFAKGLSHRLFVPAQDEELFSVLATPDRTIGFERDLLPFWLLKLPMPGPRLRQLLRLPRRNLYLNLRGAPIRGWIAQQIMKIEAGAQSPTEIVVHMDSDGVFIRPLTREMLVNAQGLVRFYRNPAAETRATHVLWREVACRLLNVDPNSINPGDYINFCVVWRRSIVRRMIERIEKVAGTDWRVVLAREPHFSEYTLYGVFVESLGIEAAGHFAAEQSQVHAIWDIEPETPQEEDEFIDGLETHHIALLIQSTARMPFGKRLELLERAKGRARNMATD
ncbi:hypothetical protein CCR94_06800 [Rhodoblastus sphagnicola]|uniref:Uncharacterized protein n=1 Tax=Rhodoblastus sphagnicola TaxID=333368 RepID=A0A2S6NBZ6_9HYPH|nr:DUF6492 family protein [Rhodoblastus sphagnicola]MBB4198687.1 hypothetical protein [Rhodoblastus sphagnicola]PPQ32127.1 hypothetical protein CCR94_06800 [Rhodoblastus sphagnicola]